MDEAHDAARANYKRKPKDEKEKLKPPRRVSSWTTVALEQWARETEDVKKLVREAVQERAEEIKLFNDPLIPAGDEEKQSKKFLA